MLTIGIDVGERRLQTIAVDVRTGEVCAATETEYPPETSIASQGWTQACSEALASLALQLGSRVRSVSALALTGNDSWVLLDDEQRAISVIDSFDRDALQSSTLVLSAKDYVAFHLCKELGTDHSAACSTGLFDGAARRWSNEALDRAKLSRTMLPPSGSSIEILGKLAPNNSLPPGLSVMRGSHHASALTTSVGAHPIGTALVSLEVVALPTEGWVDDRRRRLSAMCHGSGSALAGSVGGHEALAWYHDVLCDGERLAAEMRGSDADALICEAASTSRPGAGGVVFARVDGRAALLGMGGHTHKADVSRAVLEGLAYDIADAIDTPLEHVRVRGRLANNGFWRQLLADVLDCKVCTTDSPATAAYGAAIVAACGDGHFGSLDEAVAALVHPTACAHPDAIAHGKQSVARAVHRRLCATLGEHVDELRRLDDSSAMTPLV